MSLISATAVYRLGPSGSLADLPGIQFGRAVDVSYEDNAVKHTTLSGKRYRDVLGNEKRTWTFSWSYLLLSEVDAVKALVDAGRTAPLFLDDPFSAGVEVEVFVDSYRPTYITPFEADVDLVLMEV